MCTYVYRVMYTLSQTVGNVYHRYDATIFANFHHEVSRISNVERFRSIPTWYGYPYLLGRFTPFTLGAKRGIFNTGGRGSRSSPPFTQTTL